MWKVSLPVLRLLLRWALSTNPLLDNRLVLHLLRPKLPDFRNTASNDNPLVPDPSSGIELTLDASLGYCCYENRDDSFKCLELPLYYFWWFIGLFVL